MSTVHCYGFSLEGHCFCFPLPPLKFLILSYILSRLVLKQAKPSFLLYVPLQKERKWKNRVISFPRVLVLKNTAVDTSFVFGLTVLFSKPIMLMSPIKPVSWFVSD